MNAHFQSHVTRSLKLCPRCRKPHASPLIFAEMEHPFIDTANQPWAYAATCTNTLQPILARVVFSEETAFRFVVEGEQGGGA